MPRNETLHYELANAEKSGLVKLIERVKPLLLEKYRFLNQSL